MKYQLSKYGLLRDKDVSGFGQKRSVVEFLKAQSCEPIQWKIFIGNSSTKSLRKAMKMTFYLKLPMQRKAEYHPEKADDIPWMSFKVESAVLKKYYYSKNRCPKLWEETMKTSTLSFFNLKVNILAFYMYITNEAATTGIKLHKGKHWQMNELLNIDRNIYVYMLVIRCFYLQIEGSENVAGFQLELFILVVVVLSLPTRAED